MPQGASPRWIYFPNQFLYGTEDDGILALNRYSGLEKEFLWTYGQIDHWLHSMRDELPKVFTRGQVPTFGLDRVSSADGGGANYIPIAWGNVIWPNRVMVAPSTAIKHPVMETSNVQ